MIKILSQLASAQTYLHENHIVHGDFRSEHVNVLGPCQVCEKQLKYYIFKKKKKKLFICSQNLG